MQKVIFNTTEFGEQYYFVAGSSNVNTIILVHGFAEDHNIFTETAIALSKDFNVININLPGSGNTQIVEANPTLAYFANYILAITKNENLKNKFVLAGHSLGGYITLEFAKKHTNLLCGISLINSSIFADTTDKKETRLKALQLIANDGKEHFFRALLKNAYSVEFYNNNPTIIEKHLQMAMQISNESISKYYHAMLLREDSASTLENNTTPFQIIIGQQDAIVPLETSLKMCAIANTSFVHILPNCGHSSFYEQANLLQNKLLEFSSFCFTK